MDFVQTSKKTQLYRNKFGIKEPESNCISIESKLDLVVVPLVAFDVNKNRIGMGGGYYDRKFEKLSTNEYDIQNREPILIGLGFDCQKTEEIKTEKWDVKLTCVISESGILCQTEKIKNYRFFCEKVKPDVISIDYDVDPKIISQEINIPIQGGLDPKFLLGDKDQIKKEAIKYLDIFNHYPYIFNLGHGVIPETNPMQVDYLVKLVKDY